MDFWLLDNSNINQRIFHKLHYFNITFCITLIYITIKCN
jgi:hypothetical protein